MHFFRHRHNLDWWQITKIHACAHAQHTTMLYHLSVNQPFSICQKPFASSNRYRGLWTFSVLPWWIYLFEFQKPIGAPHCLNFMFHSCSFSYSNFCLVKLFNVRNLCCCCISSSVLRLFDFDWSSSPSDVLYGCTFP